MEYCVIITKVLKNNIDMGKNVWKIGYNRIYKVNISIQELCNMGEDSEMALIIMFPWIIFKWYDLKHLEFCLRALTLIMFNVNIYNYFCN